MKLPAELGNITGMTFLQQIDTSLGIGPLVVHAENGIAVYEVQIPRTQWGDQQIGRVIYQGPSAVSPESMARVNNELYFLSKEGIRSINQARADFSTMIDTPLSRELNFDFQYQTPWLDKYTDAFVFDKRIFWLGLPTREKRENNEVDVHHRALFVMDYDYSSELRGQSKKPVYDGIWTGLKYLGGVAGLFNNRERCFLFAVENKTNVLYELDPKLHHDDQRLIQSRLYTRGYDFRSDNRFNPVFPHNAKLLEHVDLWIEGMRDDVGIDVYYTNDDQPVWYNLGEKWEYRAPYLYKDAPTGTDIPIATERPFPDFQTFSADDTPEDITCKNQNRGYYFQLRIDISGYARIRMGRLKAKNDPSERSGAEPHYLPQDRLNVPSPDDYSYNSDNDASYTRLEI
jgi:hypothetical protein